jgi:anti-sigma regulatory factor (Ser/Thr protein kinase)
MSPGASSGSPMRAPSAVIVGGRSAETDLASTPHSAPLSRMFLREHLRDTIDPQVITTAELLTTELVTNAVMHARTSVHLTLQWDARVLLVTVEDRHPIAPDSNSVDPATMEESGRGMTLVASLADDFGWSLLGNGLGKMMWFVLLLFVEP